MDKGTLGVHQVKLMRQTAHDITHGGGVGEQADCAHDLGEISTGDNRWRLIVDSALETGRAPVDELK